jgi:LacI family transcriptional regulator
VLASAYAPPGLTTFDALILQAARDIGQLVVEIIETRPATPKNKLIRPVFVGRASHGPAPAKARN